MWKSVLEGHSRRLANSLSKLLQELSTRMQCVKGQIILVLYRISFTKQTFLCLAQVEVVGGRPAFVPCCLQHLALLTIRRTDACVLWDQVKMPRKCSELV